MNNGFIKFTDKEFKKSIEYTKVEVGLIGKIFGKGDAAKFNITAVVLFVLIVSGILSTYFNYEKSTEYWKIILPIITLALGYIWGKDKS